MKLSTVLLLTGISIGAVLFFTQTNKGNQLRRDLNDYAGNLGRRLGRLRRQSEDLFDEGIESTTQVAQKARQKANGQLA
jgi:hypothetical protein